MWRCVPRDRGLDVIIQITHWFLWLQVNICFRKVAADILGIRLMRQEIDLQQPVFKAEINTYANNDAGPTAVAAAKAPVHTRAKSSMCVVS